MVTTINGVPYGSIDYINGVTGSNAVIYMGSVIGIDADAKTFFTATGITNATQKDALNNLVIGLKSNNLWSKMQCIYPFLGGTATTHKFNLKNPVDSNAAFRLVFSGGWTHSSTGAQPNGTNGYANSFFAPSTNQSVNNNGLGMYITQRTVSQSDPVQMGSFTQVNQASLILVTATSMNARLNGGNSATTIGGGSGSFDAHRTSATVTKQYKNGTSIKNYNSGGTRTANTIYLGTLNVAAAPYASGYINSEFRFAYMSEGLTDTEVSNLRTLVQTYQTALGRNL